MCSMLLVLFLECHSTTGRTMAATTRKESAQTNDTVRPLGANAFCKNGEKTRIRRDWDLISRDDQDLYIEAIEEAIDRELYQAFLGYHADSVALVQSHETCGFALWHRTFLLAFENMLRSLAPRFACLTIPYWNVMEHSSDQARGLCTSYRTCSRIVGDLGGSPVAAAATRLYAGIEATGDLITGRPIRNLHDDNNATGIVRDDLFWVTLPASTAYDSVLDILVTSPSYVQYTRRIQETIHDDVHDTLGGFMPTYSSPTDPLFMPWHSFIDLALFMWEACYLDPSEQASGTRLAADWAFEGAGSNCSRNGRSKVLFPILNATSELYLMRGDFHVLEDPLIGIYFADIGILFSDVASIRDLGEDFDFTYDHVTERIWNVLQDPSQCPSSGSWTAFPTPSPTTASPVVGSPNDADARSEWLAGIRQRLEEMFAETHPGYVAQYMSYFTCVTQDETSLSVYTEDPGEYLVDVLNGNAIIRARCAFFLPETESVTNEELPTSSTPVAAPSENRDQFAGDDEDDDQTSTALRAPQPYFGIGLVSCLVLLVVD